MIEEWRPISDFQMYEVSNHGRVKRVIGGQGAIAGKILKWHTDTSTGYANVRMRECGISRGINVHKLVARAFLGPRPDGLEIRHLDGDKLNCCVTNLVYGTHKENQEDKVKHGRSSKGEKNPNAKINQKAAESIRIDYGFGICAKELASLHGLCESTIYRIVKGQYWQEASNRGMDRGTR